MTNDFNQLLSSVYGRYAGHTGQKDSQAAAAGRHQSCSHRFFRVLKQSGILVTLSMATVNHVTRAEHESFWPIREGSVAGVNNIFALWRLEHRLTCKRQELMTM